jgi:hypothetical protein
MVATKQDMVTLKGRTDVGHIPYQPFWLLIVRGVQLFLAVLILALAAYGGSGFWGFYAGDGVGIFTSIWSILFLCYIEISTFYLPGAYNKYVQLVFEVLSVPFWLWAWAWLAATAAAWDFVYVDTTDACLDDPYCYKLKARNYYSNGPANATKAAAALGAFEWVLFCGTLITFSIYLHRHRRAARDARQPGVSGSAVVEEYKMGTVTQQPVYVEQQQPTGYNQAPVDPRYQNVNMA